MDDRTMTGMLMAHQRVLQNIRAIFCWTNGARVRRLGEKL